MKSIELIYKEHLENKPKQFKKYFTSIKMGLKTENYIKWEIEEKNLKLVKDIPKEKRIEALNLIHKGKTCGEVAKLLKIKDHMAIFYLMHYNIQEVLFLRSESI